MDPTNPVTVIITFQLQPGGRALWLDVWCTVQKAAEAVAACRSFRLLSNTNDDAQRIVLSVWDSAADFDAFARDVGLIWIGRSMDRECGQPHYAFFKEIPNTTLRTVPVGIREIAPALIQ